MEKAQGTLTTPNWPESDYPPGISCSWHIIAPSNQVLTFLCWLPTRHPGSILKGAQPANLLNIYVLILELAPVEAKTP